MIKNQKQYRITKAQAERFARTLQNMRQQASKTRDLHPVIAKAQEDALVSQLADLKGELREYESLKAGEFDMDALNLVADLPTVLIAARIARGLTQKELAERAGLKEQQIQRYEATDYSSASLSRIKEVVSILEAR